MKPPINIRSAIMPKDDAEKLIGDYASRILKSIQAGWQRRINVQNACKEDFSILSDRSISSNVYDWVAHALQLEFKDDVPEVRVLTKYKSVRLVIKDLLITKVNKANALGRISRNNTLVQTRFDTQQPEQAVLPNFLYPTNIIITWQLNAAGTEIDTVSVRCPISPSENAWEFVIKSPTEGEIPAQFSTTLEPTGRTSRVTSKKPGVQEHELE